MRIFIGLRRCDRRPRKSVTLALSFWRQFQDRYDVYGYIYDSELCYLEIVNGLTKSWLRNSVLAGEKTRCGRSARRKIERLISSNHGEAVGKLHNTFIRMHYRLLHPTALPNSIPIVQSLFWRSTNLNVKRVLVKLRRRFRIRFRIASAKFLKQGHAILQDTPNKQNDWRNSNLNLNNNLYHG